MTAKRADFCKGCPVGGHFNETDQTCSENDPSDGLPLTCVGEWVEEKHARLRKYVDISHATRRKFLNRQGGATYIDPFCGPGRSRVRHSTKIVDGSALVAAREAERTKSQFTALHIADLNPAFALATTRRLADIGVAATSRAGTADATVTEISRVVPVAALNFAFLDPYDLRTLPFMLIHQLASLQRIDLLIHVSVQDLNRNLRRYMAANAAPLDAFAPGWREVVAAPGKDSDLRNRIFQKWLGKIREENLQPAQGVELVTGSREQPLYWLVFAARHELPIKFWNEIRNVVQQRQMDF